MILGLTGGIGSGKSIVAKVFETMGCIIYHSDDHAKNIYFDESVKPSIIQLLGKEAYLSDTEINKSYISQKIFNDAFLLHQLNAIIHPAVKNDFKKFTEVHPDKMIIKESAILFETNLYKEVDYSILVTATIDLRIERVIKRNGITKQEVEKRMEAQWNDEQKKPLANFIIVNDHSTALIPQVIAIIDKIKAHA